MQGILYEEPTVWLFLLVTVIMGGWLAWMSGRAIALTWRPNWQLVVYMLILGLFVRFIHFALFQATLLTLHYYIVDTIVLLIFGFAGWRYNRAKQMTRQYHWLFERTGPFGWKPRAGAEIRPELL
ncbi:DUF6867 family protein [Bosea sp. NBC_00550]|uniref:DUF6867 family protein n=1 Tax=Bosea sp. NBC_00550 TaxID=2969621 RepID=UPI00222F2487|nr:hypothetical protein [Bosea sp. NBC_00550]UZF94263.1 hypothetical protein NWE53_08780 [Bosea sp. NBC_00550]